MVKILMGLAVAIAIAAGGFFGFGFYTQQRVASEVEAAFEQIRAAGGKASHGKVSFDLSTRTVTIADIVTESNAPTPVSVKIASFTAFGARQPDPARFAADTIEAADIEIGLSMAAQPGGRVTYKAPRITVKDYSGPGSLHAAGFVVHHRHLPFRGRAIHAGQRIICDGPCPYRNHEFRRRRARRRRG